MCINRIWTQEEIDIVKNEYEFGNTADIAKRLNRSVPAVSMRAKLLNISKSHSIYRDTHCDKLLDGSLESMYWIGFIFADGYISKHYRLKICLSRVDIEHLQKMAAFLGVKTIYNTTSNGSFGTHKLCEIRVRDRDNLKTLTERFDLKHNKTYNPPDFSTFDLTDEQMLAMIIGFIDGDGCISKVSNIGYNIKFLNHSSWFTALEFMSEFIIKFYKSDYTAKPKLNGYGYATVAIGDNCIIKRLYEFVREHSLPVLERKWSKLHNMQAREKVTPKMILEFKKLRADGLTLKEIGTIYGFSLAHISRCLQN